MKHQTIPLFALPLTRTDIDCGGIAEFFDTVVKPSKGRSNTERAQWHAVSACRR
jgi:hypothetical protein